MLFIISPKNIECVFQIMCMPASCRITHKNTQTDTDLSRKKARSFTYL